MERKIVLCVLNAKYIHASPAPFCLSAGIKAYAADFFAATEIVEATINQPVSDITAVISAKKPDIIGFSCYLWNIKQTLELCCELKKLFPEIITVLGGPEVSYSASTVLSASPQADYILSGEGETSFPEFVKALYSCGLPPVLPSEKRVKIAGLCGRNADGSVYESAPCVLSGSVPSPLSAGYTEASKNRITYFETSRGCPYSCAFCLSGRCGKPRYFEDEGIFSNLIKIASGGTKTVKFVDRTFNANPAHANKILRFILEHYGKEIPNGVCFHFEIAGDILKEETFLLLEQMPLGAVQLEIGMQSFCEKTLEAVHRKTNTGLLQKNIKRLIAMQNMHIHIDLIAGLPYEDLRIFEESFNTGYALGAQMLQLGFLKLLYGSAMRDFPEEYPCVYSKNPPYEVCSTPWLSEEDIELLHRTEDSVERVYNSGRFRHTAEYVLRASGITPFDFYCRLGIAAKDNNPRITLDDYTDFFMRFCEALDGIDKEELRDYLVRDRLSVNRTGRLPKCLLKSDEQLKILAKKLRLNKSTAPQEGIHRGIAILYHSKRLCWADYDLSKYNPVTRSWVLKELPLSFFETDET